MNTAGLTIHVRIVRYGNNAGMAKSFVQWDVVSAIAGKDCTAQVCREGELVGIRDGPIGLTCFKCGEDIIAELPQPLHDGERKVLVRVKVGHGAYASSLRRMASSISVGWSA